MHMDLGKMKSLASSLESSTSGTVEHFYIPEEEEDGTPACSGLAGLWKLPPRKSRRPLLQKTGSN